LPRRRPLEVKKVYDLALVEEVTIPMVPAARVETASTQRSLGSNMTIKRSSSFSIDLQLYVLVAALEANLLPTRSSECMVVSAQSTEDSSPLADLALMRSRMKQLLERRKKDEEEEECCDIGVACTRLITT
jgi:hypothetical protein